MDWERRLHTASATTGPEIWAKVTNSYGKILGRESRRFVGAARCVLVGFGSISRASNNTLADPYENKAVVGVD